MLEVIIMNKIKQMIVEQVNQILKHDSSGHNLDHIMRVYHLALQISSKEGGNTHLIGIASLLHDVDDSKLITSSTDDLENATKIMNSVGLSQEDIIMIKQIIHEISYSKQIRGVNTSSIEAKIVQDADRLDAIGAIGIARTFAYGGANRRPMFGSANQSSLVHFYDKLLKLQGLINTDYAKQLAKRRHEFLMVYLTELNQELNEAKG